MGFKSRHLTRQGTETRRNQAIDNNSKHLALQQIYRIAIIISARYDFPGTFSEV